MNEELIEKFDLSSRKRRIVAFLIDHFVMSFLMVFVAFLLLGPNFMNENNEDRMITIMLIVMIPGFLIYFAKDTIKGISVGKWTLGIMVRDEKEQNEVPSLGKLFARNLFIILWPIEFIVLAVSKSKKRLGDKIFKTVVLKNPDKPKRLTRIFALIGIGVVIISFTYLFAGIAMKNSDAYKIALLEIEQDHEILTETGGIIGYGMFPKGNVNINNGFGQAQLGIKVLGNDKDVKVRVYLIKEPNEEWKLIELNK